MKRLLSMIPLVFAVAAMAVRATPARAEAQTQREEFFTMAFDPSSGEPVMIEGERFVTVRDTQIKGGATVLDVRITAHGAGLGLWTGAQYRFNETYNYHWVDPAGLAYTITSQDVMRLVSCGADPNLRVTQTMLVSRDAAGVYTFDFTYDTDLSGRP